MSKKGKKILFPPKLPPIILSKGGEKMGLLPKFVDDAAGPPAQAVGKTLSSLWDLGIGNHVSLWIKKQEIRQQQNLQDYIKKVEEKTQQIPEENLTEPHMHIVGPAIEASKFYIDSEQLRQMFANLIAASIDDRKIKKTHPSFVEIIKQLSPLDAGILANFKRRTQIPIAEIRIVKENKEYITIQDHVMNFTNRELFKTQVSSISNLQRLGLLNIQYGIYSTAKGDYDYVKEHPAFNAATEKLSGYQKVDPQFIRVDFEKGLCRVTPICEDFIGICL